MGKDSPTYLPEEARAKIVSDIMWSLKAGTTIGLVASGLNEIRKESLRSTEATEEPNIIVDTVDYCPKLPQVTCTGAVFVEQPPEGMSRSVIIFEMARNDEKTPHINVKEICEPILTEPESIEACKEGMVEGTKVILSDEEAFEGIEKATVTKNVGPGGDVYGDNAAVFSLPGACSDNSGGACIQFGNEEVKWQTLTSAIDNNSEVVDTVDFGLAPYYAVTAITVLAALSYLASAKDTALIKSGEKISHGVESVKGVVGAAGKAIGDAKSAVGGAGKGVIGLFKGKGK